MLELLLKLLDNAIKLAGLREKNRSDYFQRYVQPTYELAEAVYRDYRSLLQDLRKMVLSHADREVVVGFLNARREEVLPVRRRLRAVVAHSLQEGRSTRFEAGVWAMLTGAVSALDRGHVSSCEYDAESQSVVPVIHGHTLLDLLEVFQTQNRGTRDQTPRYLRAVDAKQIMLERAWQLVLSGYAGLHAATLPAVRLPRRETAATRKAAAGIRTDLAKIHGMIASGRYGRKAGIDLEKMVAAAAPQLLHLAMDVRGTLHDLDNEEPNVTADDLKRSLARLESGLSDLETGSESAARSRHPSRSGRAPI